MAIDQERIEVQGVPVPRFLYGTAWKEEATEGLVRTALAAGFRGIDTANQRKHYHEAGVGAAVKEALGSGRIAREDLFLQTKFTHLGGQDHRLPYDPAAPVTTQVAQSFASSLEHLGVDRLDSYVLHGPSTRSGLAPEDWEAWRAMETLHQEGRVRLLGVSNVTRDQLALLCREAKVTPAFVQNRCYARTGWDRGVRQVCAERGIVYQGFSLLTANPHEIASPPFQRILARTGGTAPQLVFRFALALGFVCLTGTRDRNHMEQDLASPALDLAPDEVATLESISG